MEDIIGFIGAMAFLFGMVVAVYAVGFLIWEGVKKVVSWICGNDGAGE